MAADQQPNKCNVVLGMLSQDTQLGGWSAWSEFFRLELCNHVVHQCNWQAPLLPEIEVPLQANQGQLAVLRKHAQDHRLNLLGC